MRIANCKLRIHKRGMTLVELLVAISILVILMAVGAHMMQFSVEDRRTREAARAINVYISSARNRAMESGRPCGVMLRRLPTQPPEPPSFCVVGLEQVEVPPAYAGDTLEATAQVQMVPLSGSPTSDFWPDGSRKAVAKFNNFARLLVHVDDLVQFDYQGPLYTIKGPVSADPPDKPGYRTVVSDELQLGVHLRPGETVPWPFASTTPPNWSLSPAVPYQIFRQPAKSAAAGLQLPVRAVIDLEASGRDIPSTAPVTDYPKYSFGAPAAPAEPVIIMYSPTGGIERVYCTYPKNAPSNEYIYGPLPVTAPIFLLVGKQERVPAGSAEDGLTNWEDLKNFWVTLNPQSGLVTTAEVARGASVAESREIAREGQSMGGR